MANNFGQIILVDSWDNFISFPQYVHSYWKMDATSGGEVNYRTTSGYDLSQSGSISSSSGVISNSRGTYSDSNFFEWSSGGSSSTVYDTNNFIFEFWFKHNTTSGAICGKSGGSSGWWVDLTGGVLTFVLWGITGIAAASAYNDNNWHYCVVGCRNSSGANEARMYVDNVSVGTPQTGATWTKDTGNLMVGKRSSVTTAAFNGYLDEIAYWNTVPSTWTEIESIILQRWNNGIGKSYG